MRKRVFKSKSMAAAVRTADRLLNQAVALVLVVALLYSGFCLWDTWKVCHDAQLDNDLMKYHPTVGDGSNPSLEDLQAINPDVCAWLTVDGTNIDYPVVRGESNNDYINRDVYREFSLSGSIFLDYRNARDFSDYYSIIYGHHMAGDVMFGEIPYFAKTKYFNQHTTGTLYLPGQTYDIQWFACVETDAYDESMYALISADNINYEEEMDSLLDYISQTATQYRDIGVTSSDHLIALSTCSETKTNGRTLLIGRINP
jgi:sortase B